MPKTKREYSAGGVVYKKENHKLYFLLGKHSGYHKWVLPKGLIEEGEDPKATAVRETEEEMGVKARLINKKPIHIITYVYFADLKKITTNTRRVEKYQEQGGGKTKVFKTVTFYLLECVSGDPKDHGWEMEEVGWYTLKQAIKKMSFKGEIETLQKACQMLTTCK